MSDDWPPQGWTESPGGGIRPATHISTARRTSWTAAELMAATFPDPRFAVDGLIPEGLTFMCGAPKLGKSWLALGLAIAVASGGKAVGTIDVEPGPVLYLALEDSPRRLQSRLGLVLRGGEPPTGLDMHTEWPRLDEGGLAGIERWHDANPSGRLILLDVWPRIRPRAERKTDYYQVDYDAAAGIQGWAMTRGIAAVALFHTRKAEADDFVETVQGTFGTAAAADTIIVVKRSRGRADAVLHITGRDVNEAELALEFSAQAGTWALLGDAAVWALARTRRVLLEAIEAHTALTPKRAAEVTGVDHDLVRQTLRRMAADGQLEGNGGTYTLRPPVTGVTTSPDGGQGDRSDRGLEGGPDD